ncbi:NADPH-dependent FMN reductase [Saccharomonospora sp. CUA-673]|uniref:NADPH-dependent FMN reductase n=1 Tax=Saccharomonospora sp. CUA-673 TaxID=1904969 RepID=UPI0035140EFD
MTNDISATGAHDTNTSNDTAGATGGRDRLRLAVVIGSTRTDRFGPVPSSWFAGEARKHDGFDVDLVDLAGLDLPNSLDGPPTSTRSAPASATPTRSSSSHPSTTTVTRRR